MHCRVLSMDFLPHQPQILHDYLQNYPRVNAFYQHQPNLENILKVARSLDFPQERQREVAGILRQQNRLLGSGAATFANLDRLEKGALAVVSGQQVGLFGGPAYAFYKAIAAARIAKDLAEQGIDAVPVFWMATEDHDLDEIRYTNFFRDGKLLRVELPGSVGSGAPVGRIPLGPEVAEAVAAAVQALGEGTELAGVVAESYRPEETYGSAYGKLFAKLLAECGLILMDPLDLRLHRLAEPLFANAIEKRDELEQDLLARGQALESAGYDPQVKVTERSTVLFHISSDGRQPIAWENDGFVSGKRKWERSELLAEIHAEPENFSPNALLRSVTQDFLLPTVAYIGGPSEISYFAQSEVLYRKLLNRMPVMLPRAGFTLVDTKAKRLLKQYEIEVEDVWRGPQELRKLISKASLPENIANLLQENAREIKLRLQQWADAVSVLDPTLKNAVETAQEKIGYQTEKLQEKIGRALDQKQHVLAAHEEFLSNLLYPNKTLQSREISFLSFLARWGKQGLEEIERHSGVKGIGSHFVIPTS